MLIDTFVFGHPIEDFLVIEDFVEGNFIGSG